MITALVWILVLGYEGGHTPPVSMGDFATREGCLQVANLKTLQRYDRECVQVLKVYQK